MENQEADSTFQAVKRRLPREIKLKLAKVARLAVLANSAFPDFFASRYKYNSFYGKKIYIQFYIFNVMAFICEHCNINSLLFAAAGKPRESVKGVN